MSTGGILSALSVPIALVILTCGLLILIISPRLAQGHQPTYSQVVKRTKTAFPNKPHQLLWSWLRLMCYEAIATLCIYGGMCFLGILTPLPLLTVILVVIISALALSCILSRYV